MTRYMIVIPPLRMQRFIFVCAVAAVCVAPSRLARAQDRKLMKAEDVLAKWTEKTGGEAWKSVRNRVMNGTVEFPLLHLKGPITSYAAGPGSKYEVWELNPGQAIERGCEGSVAWETAPGKAAEVLVGNAKATALLDATFVIELRWPEFFAKVETQAIKSVKYLAVGDQPESKRPCYEVKMTPKDPDCEPELWYIDTENFQRIGTAGMVMSADGLVNRQRLFADYRSVNDVLVPFVVCEQLATKKQILQKQIIEYKSIQHNVRMSKYRFELPDAVKKQIAETGKPAATSAPTTQPANAPDKSAKQVPEPNATPQPLKTEER